MSHSILKYITFLFILIGPFELMAGYKAKNSVEAGRVHNLSHNGQRILGQGVIIAVLDTGLNILHPHVNNKIAVKTNEVLDNKDNDGNKLKDDRNGWNFHTGKGLVFDDHGHGTHVAATIVDEYYGIAPKASIVPIKISTTPKGNISDQHLIDAIKYAADNGARIINLSLRGYYGNSPVTKYVIEEAIKYAEKKNALLVVAAGNDNRVDITNQPILPAGSDSENVLVVCAVDDRNNLASFSNYSSTKVDVCAPGVDIFAANHKYFDTFINGVLQGNGEPESISMSGTSMSAPIVSGIAALLMSVDSNLSAKKVKKIIMESAARKRGLYPQLKSRSVTESVVNAYDAIWEYLNYYAMFF